MTIGGFYEQYLTGLCTRRAWGVPTFRVSRSKNGFSACARVNNREYHTESEFGQANLARESAAMKAYLICRNFSVNDGKYPAGMKPVAGVIQGMPTVIGGERRGRNSMSSTSSFGSDEATVTPSLYPRAPSTVVDRRGAHAQAGTYGRHH